MKRKRIALYLLIGCLFIPTIIFGKGVDIGGYNKSLEKIGIDHQTFNRMPKSKQEIYDNLEVGDLITKNKYFRIETPINSKNLTNKLGRYSLNNNQYDAYMEENIVEISKEQFIFEVQNDIDKQFMFSVKNNSDIDDTITSWVEMTTTLSWTGTQNKWPLINDVTYIKSNGFLEPITTHIVGLGTNANFSIVKDSEYLLHKYTIYAPDLGIYKPNQEDYIFNPAEKSASGYAYTVDIAETQISNTMTMAVVITPNVSNTTVVDGYGHYSKYSRAIDPTLEFSSGGASLTITPTSRLVSAPKTHVQLFR